MQGTGPYRPTLIGAGVQRLIPSDGSAFDFRVGYPGWDHSSDGSWDEWGPVCMLPGLRQGCMCPWCPREVTGGYSVMRVV